MSNDLTKYEQEILEYWLRSKQSLRSIATVMRRSHSVLSKEIKKNGGSERKKYRADKAQKIYEKRKQQKRRGKLGMDKDLCEYVEGKLALQWSPEQIAGRLKEAPPKHLGGKYISQQKKKKWIL